MLMPGLVIDVYVVTGNLLRNFEPGTPAFDRHAWFLEIAFVQEVGMCICLCVCVPTPQAMKNHSCEMKPK